MLPEVPQPNPLPQTASPSALPSMNQSAATQSSGSSGGVTQCTTKTYFAMIISLVDEKGAETYPGAITVNLQVTGPGALQRMTAGGPSPIFIAQLDPGGTGDVLQMTHTTDVFEAIGDFS
jgi:hypothetical protein